MMRDIPTDDKNKVFRHVVVYVTYWVDGTSKKMKCSGCGCNMDIPVPFHFQLCNRCRVPIWNLARFPSEGRKLLFKRLKE